MASTKLQVQFPVNLGMDQSDGWKSKGWYLLENMRPKEGVLQQVPRWTQRLAVAVGTWANPPYSLMQYTKSSVNGYLAWGQTPVFIPESDPTAYTFMPCVVRFSIPNNNETVTGQCLMTGINLTDFSALNDLWEVEVTATNQFNVTKNGGTPVGYTLTSSKTLTISANGLKLYFLTDTGFTIGEKWSWKRLDIIPGYGFVDSFLPVSTVYKTDTYIPIIGRIVRARGGIIEDVGYGKVAGRFVTVYQNHLVVAGAAVVNASLPPTDTPFTVAWSHLNNPDEFFATSLNEADTYVIPRNMIDSGASLGITGLQVLGNGCYVYTADSIYEMQYVGLPIVMQILPKIEGVGNAYPSSLVATPQGHYFIGRSNIYYFNGVEVTAIGDPIKTALFAELPAVGVSTLRDKYVTGFYDPHEQEVIFNYQTSTYANKAVVFQVKTGQWHFRNLYTTVSAPAVYTYIRGLCKSWSSVQKNVMMACNNSYVYMLQEAAPTPGSGAFQDDPESSYKYSRPLAVSNWITLERPFETKEFDNAVFDYKTYGSTTGLISIMARFTDALGSVPTYSAHTLLKSLTASSLGTQTAVSFPRSANKAISLKITDGTVAAADTFNSLAINALGIDVYGPPLEDKER